MNRKRIAVLLVAGVVIATMLMVAIAPGFAYAQYDQATSPADTSGGTTSGGTTSGGTTTGGTTTGGKTGAELIVFGLAGAALIGSGYFLTRKSRA